jgi:hypothetical protein
MVNAYLINDIKINGNLNRLPVDKTICLISVIHCFYIYFIYY